MKNTLLLIVLLVPPFLVDMKPSLRLLNKFKKTLLELKSGLKIVSKDGGIIEENVRNVDHRPGNYLTVGYHGSNSANPVFTGRFPQPQYGNFVVIQQKEEGDILYREENKKASDILYREDILEKTFHDEKIDPTNVDLNF